VDAKVSDKKNGANLIVREYTSWLLPTVIDQTFHRKALAVRVDQEKLFARTRHHPDLASTGWPQQWR
jgi:hypothetical protein